jgi:hypothetical protein
MQLYSNNIVHRMIPKNFQSFKTIFIFQQFHEIHGRQFENLVIYPTFLMDKQP